MTGPYRLKSPRDVVPRGCVGVYLLAHRTNGPIKYVGSNPDGGTLRSRLTDHASEGKYSYYWFEVTANAKTALQRECREYKKYLRTLDNKIRPKLCRALNHWH